MDLDFWGCVWRKKTQSFNRKNMVCFKMYGYTIIFSHHFKKGQQLIYFTWKMETFEKVVYSWLYCTQNDQNSRVLVILSAIGFKGRICSLRTPIEKGDKKLTGRVGSPEDVPIYLDRHYSILWKYSDTGIFYPYRNLQVLKYWTVQLS